MKFFLSRRKPKLLGSTSRTTSEAIPDPLNYDKLIALDAEDPAEQRILSANLGLLPGLKKFAGSCVEVIEHVDNDKASYSVSSGGENFIPARA